MKRFFSFFLLVILVLPAEKKEKEKKALLYGSIAVVLALPLDSSIRHLSINTKSEIADGIAEFSNYFGDGKVVVPFVLLTGTSGLIFKDRKLFRTSFEALESFVVAGVITNVLKTVTMRKRPSTSEDPLSFSWGNRSFPSGHVTVASAVSTVFAREYKCKAFYIIPVLTAFARIRKNAHWLSDTIAGFTVGYIVGGYVVRKKGFFTIYPTRDGFEFIISIGG